MSPKRSDNAVYPRPCRHPNPQPSGEQEIVELLVPIPFEQDVDAVLSPVPERDQRLGDRIVALRGDLRRDDVGGVEFAVANDPDLVDASKFLSDNVEQRGPEAAGEPHAAAFDEMKIGARDPPPRAVDILSAMGAPSRSARQTLQGSTVPQPTRKDRSDEATDSIRQ